MGLGFSSSAASSTSSRASGFRATRPFNILQGLGLYLGPEFRKFPPIGRFLERMHSLLIDAIGHIIDTITVNFITAAVGERYLWGRNQQTRVRG